MRKRAHPPTTSSACQRGKIRYKEAPAGQSGSTFSFSIPMRRCDAPASPDRGSARWCQVRSLDAQDKGTPTPPCDAGTEGGGTGDGMEAHPGAGRAAGHLDGIRILVVDDARVNSRILGRIFQKAGAAVDLAFDGATALQLFKEHGSKSQGVTAGFDLIWTDLEMPGIDGRELAALIRAISPRTPVVACTGHAPTEVMNSTSKTDGDFDAVVSKPCPALDMVRLALELASKSRVTVARPPSRFPLVATSVGSLRSRLESPRIVTPTSSPDPHYFAGRRSVASVSTSGRGSSSSFGSGRRIVSCSLSDLDSFKPAKRA